MPNVFIIIGNRGHGKSRTIRALTGTYQGNRYHDVATRNNNINIYVQSSALQESNISPQQFINDHADDSYILVTLWIRESRTQPNGQVYIQHFHQANWNISHIVVFDGNPLPYSLPPNLPQPVNIQNYSPNMPSNEIANQIRNQWNWL